MALNKQEIVEVYRKRAKRYNFTAQLYYLLGFREWAYREKAVEALALKRGDAVVEIGCGTGLNFGLLENEIGREGKIVGVDLTDAMLGGAQERIHRNGWSNVELVQSDAATFQFPRRVDGIISTFALTHVAEYEKVIRAGSEALRPGGRFVILDFKLPTNWISRLAPLLVLTVRPFGVTIDLAERHPWEALKKYFADVTVHQLYGGLAYIAVGNSDIAKSTADSKQTNELHPGEKRDQANR
jgi:demethylmenaquinone methyltransferase/2-methoxy-6-polyprenyl-1,4-benzoquinol methylase